MSCSGRAPHPGQPGATWLELLIDFELDKGIRVPHTLEARSSIVPVESPAVAALVRTFRLLFQDVLSSRFHPETAAAFGPKNARGSRLRPLAVSTALAAAGVVPLLPRGRALDVAAAIREIVGGDFAAARAGIEAGTAGAIVKALSLKVPPKWRAHANMHDLPAGNLLSAFREDPGVSQDRFFLACPLGCGARWAFPAKPVQGSGVWPQKWCHRCRRQLRVGRARCIVCDLELRSCVCSAALQPGVQRRSSADLRSFFRP